jgi:hypothetical protein
MDGLLLSGVQVAAAAELGDGSAFLGGIHVMRVHDHTEQMAAVHHLPALLKQHPKGEHAKQLKGDILLPAYAVLARPRHVQRFFLFVVCTSSSPQTLHFNQPTVRLVVVDSVAFHFRHGVSATDFSARSRHLATMGQKLNELAHKAAVAVVLLNQMTTKVKLAVHARNDTAAAATISTHFFSLFFLWNHQQQVLFLWCWALAADVSPPPLSSLRLTRRGPASCRRSASRGRTWPPTASSSSGPRRTKPSRRRAAAGGRSRTGALSWHA